MVEPQRADHWNIRKPIEAALVAPLTTAIYDYRAAGSVIKDPRKFYCLCSSVWAMCLCCFLTETTSTGGPKPKYDI